MNSTQPDEPYRQLSLWDNIGDAPQNIQRDDLVEASIEKSALSEPQTLIEEVVDDTILEMACLLYTSPSPRDLSTSRMPSSA